MNSRLLIVHDSRMARSLMRRMLLAEMPDFTIDEATDQRSAVKLLTENVYDVVLCNEVLADGSRRMLLETFRLSGSGATAGYVFILSETTTAENKQELASAGMTAFLQIPFTGEQVAIAVSSVRNPRNRRQHRRVNIPECDATIDFGAKPIVASVINLSTNGMLVEFDYDPQLGDIFRVASVELRLPPDFPTSRIGKFRARAIRVRALEHRANFLPDRVRAGWEFLAVPEELYDKLEAVIEQAGDGEDLPAVESRAFTS